MPRETLGDILRSKKLFAHAGLCLAFDFTIIAYYKQDLWTEFHEIHTWGTYGLIMGNCLGFFASNISLISWVLVDENSCLGKALILLVTSLPLSICGAYILVRYFNYGATLSIPCNRYHIKSHSHCKNSTAHIITIEFSAWMPVLACMNFLQGIVGLIFFLLVCLLFDGKNTGNS